jgi:hypothetical protein
MALPLGAARYSQSVRMRVGLAGFLVCATLASCTRAAPEPHPDHTLEPSITESSPMPTANPDNPACTLLTSEERTDMVGYSLNAEVPVRPDPGTEECMWIHSLREPAWAAVRVTTLSTRRWARLAAPQLRAAIVKPETGKDLRAKLEAALVDVVARGDKLPAKKVCETYVLLAESYGAVRSEQQVFYATIGAMRAAFGMACEGGILTIAGYGEYGLGPSLALSRGVTKLAEAASKRATKALGEADVTENTKSPSPSASGSDEDASPSPQPSPTETESDSDNES